MKALPNGDGGPKDRVALYYAAAKRDLFDLLLAEIMSRHGITKEQATIILHTMVAAYQPARREANRRGRDGW